MLVVVLSVWLAPSRSSAQMLGHDPGVLASPGTLTIAWCTIDATEPQVRGSVRIGEWNIGAKRWRFQKKLRDVALCPEVLRLARAGGAMVLAIADLATRLDGPAAMEIVRLERSERPSGFEETASTTLAGGFGASLDASADAVVVGSFEDLPTPVDPHVQKPPAPRRKLHLRVLDPVTLSVVSARALYGRDFLRPHLLPSVAGRAVAIVGSSVQVGVPDDKPRLATFALPSLRPLAERELATEVRTSGATTTSVVLDRAGSRVTIRAEAPAQPAAVTEALATPP